MELEFRVVSFMVSNVALSVIDEDNNNSKNVWFAVWKGTEIERGSRFGDLCY
jgi:hypothetical protein